MRNIQPINYQADNYIRACNDCVNYCYTRNRCEIYDRIHVPRQECNTWSPAYRLRKLKWYEYFMPWRWKELSPNKYKYSYFYNVISKEKLYLRYDKRYIYLNNSVYENDNTRFTPILPIEKYI